MPITPLDLQTNMSQIAEVGKTEHARAEALVAQQHLLDKESADKARTANTKTDETQKGEKTAIRHEEHNERNRNRQHRQSSQEKKEKPEKPVDDRMGRFIDILK